MIQKDLLTTHSLFFHRALLGDFREAHANIVAMPEDDPDAFGSFVRWMYTGEYEQQTCPTVIKSAKAWILGDKLGATAFKNSIIQHLIDGCKNQWIEPRDLRYVYAHTAAGSKLQLYFAHQAAFEFQQQGYPLEHFRDEWSSTLQEGGDSASDLFFSFACFEGCVAAKPEDQKRNGYLDTI